MVFFSLHSSLCSLSLFIECGVFFFIASDSPSLQWVYIFCFSALCFFIFVSAADLSFYFFSHFTSYFCDSFFALHLSSSTFIYLFSLNNVVVVFVLAVPCLVMVCLFCVCVPDFRLANAFNMGNFCSYYICFEIERREKKKKHHIENAHSLIVSCFVYHGAQDGYNNG